MASLARAAPDYPYDEEPATTVPGATAPTPPADGLPIEKPAPALRKNAPTGPLESETPTAPATRRSLPNLFRFGVKTGFSWNFVHSSGGNFSGYGIDALVSAGWDLAYQPVYLELESGYRGHFLNDNPAHIVPLKFGVFYRERIGAKNLWKPGLSASLDLRLEKDAAAETAVALVPALHVSSLWEFDRYLIEPMLSIYRVESALTSVTFAFRGGYRF